MFHIFCRIVRLNWLFFVSKQLNRGRKTHTHTQNKRMREREKRDSNRRQQSSTATVVYRRNMTICQLLLISYAWNLI